MSIIDLPSMAGTWQRVSSFVFELLDKDLTILGRLTVDADRPPTINNNINRTIKRRMSNFRFPRSQALDVDMLSNRVRVKMVMGGIQYPLGVFLFADPTIARSTKGDWVDTTLVDQGLMLDQPSAWTHSAGPGQLIRDVIITLLDQRLVKDHNIESTGAKIGGEWVVWPAGTSDMEVINDLCSLAGFYSLYFDNAGVATGKSVPVMATSEPDFVYETGTTVIAETITESNDLLSAPNRYIVVNNGMSDTPIFGWWDVPEHAPHSIARRGTIIGKTKDAQGIVDNGQAFEMARAWGESDKSTYEHASFSTITNPLHDTFNIIQWDNLKWHEQDWSLTCFEGADMRHDVRRVY